jgi:hypothetical protein
MEIRRLSSGVRAIALLVVSITMSAAIVAAILIDTLTAPALSASAPLDCATTVHPVHTLEFIEGC